MTLQVFINIPGGDQRSESKIRERNAKRKRVKAEQGIAKGQQGKAAPKGYRSASVGESRGKGRSAVTENKPKSPCWHCNGTGDSVVTDTYGSTETVRLSWQKGDEVYSAVLPMSMVFSTKAFPPPSHIYPSGHKAGPKGGGKSNEEFYYDTRADNR